MTSILIESVTDFMAGNCTEAAKIEKVEIIRVIAVGEKGGELQYSSWENNL